MERNFEKSSKIIESIKCYASDEGYEIQPIDYGVRLNSKKGAFLLDVWAKHTKGGAVKWFTIHDWITNQWIKNVGYETVESKINNYKKYLQKEHRERPVNKWRRY